MRMRYLQLAIDICGGQSALARAIGKKQGHIWWWLSRSGRVPAEQVIAIEKATQGRVTRHELRPDIYQLEDAK
ncbi:helix-turn-helix domain-containing protein [Gluconobacter cerinus]|uniref:helix-turn-helix domain-containing protein n=1 Tax=Gluconobacter cerinus TaxID=38307 RepID=UPI003AB4878E